MARRTPKITVAFIEQSAQMGGVEVTTLETVKGLDQSRFNPLVICPEQDELTEHLQRLNIPTRIVPRPKLYSVSARLGSKLVPNPLAILANAYAFWHTANRLIGVIQEKADVVVTKGLIAHFYGGLAAAHARVPCIWHVQEVVNTQHLFGLYQKILNKGAGRWAKLIIADASSVANQFNTRLHSQQRVHILHNGIDTHRFSPTIKPVDLHISKKTEVSPIYIGQIGRIVPLKGQEVLLRAFTQLHRRWPDSYLLFVGSPLFDTDHYLVKLRQMVADAELDDRVYFLGFRRDIPQIMAALDIVVHPSIEPDSPVSILEALAAGRPVIASSVPGTTELFQDSNEGFLVPPNDSQALAEKLEFLIANPLERATIGANGRKAAEERFSSEQYINTFQQLIEQALS